MRAGIIGRQNIDNLFIHTLGSQQLRFIQTLIDIRGHHQRLVRAVGDNAVGGNHRAESVDYQGARPILHDILQGIVDIGLTVGDDLTEPNDDNLQSLDLCSMHQLLQATFYQAVV